LVVRESCGAYLPRPKNARHPKRGEKSPGAAKLTYHDQSPAES
jgi:hypothetical protein